MFVLNTVTFAKMGNFWMVKFMKQVGDQSDAERNIVFSVPKPSPNEGNQTSQYFLLA